MKYLIIGIDPGTTTAYAVMDLNGKIVSIKSSKKFGERELIQEIMGLGKAIIIASDRKRAPSFVKKISSRLNAKLICPDHDLGGKEKKILTQNFKLLSHKRDALAAAMVAYGIYEDLFKRIEASVPKKRQEVVKKKLVLDEAMNIRDAMIEEKEEEKKEKKIKVRTGEDEIIELKRKNHLMRKKIKDLEEKLRDSSQKIRSLSKVPGKSIDSVSEHRLQNIRHLSKEMRKLRNEMKILETKNKIFSSGGVPLDQVFILGGRKVIVGKAKGAICLEKSDFKILEIDGVEYVAVKEIEKAVGEKIIEDVISDYRMRNQRSKT